MKKALILTYYWPPSGGAGVQRWLKFVKYFRESGWEPVVYTPENPEYPEHDPSLLKDVPEGIEVIRTPIHEPYGAYKRLIGQKKEEKIQAGFLSVKKKNPLVENLSVWIRGNLFIPDARCLWIGPSVRFLTRYLTEHPVHAIISTGPPHSMHRIAYGLKKRIKIPWLADFRDPWTGIDFYGQLKLTRFADKKHHRQEREVLSAADRVTVVSWHWAMDLEKLWDREYDVVTNGFDPDDFRTTGIPVREPFELTHVGSLNRDRNPGLLWEVLAGLCRENAQFRQDLKLRFIGKCDHSLFADLEKYGLKDLTAEIAYMPHAEVIRESAASQVLLLLLNNTPNVLGIVPGKIFEYLATRRPVLCIGPPEGDSARILRESGAGETCGFSDREAMRTAILGLYDRYRAGKLESCDGDFDAFSRRRLTAKITAILDEMTHTT
ncbi:MAG TPA: glycosyl transferase family 1 [Bacteroidales bacterium]|nr:glycosyl transferase family 1 [Bacteroidales bacterium]